MESKTTLSKTSDQLITIKLIVSLILLIILFLVITKKWVSNLDESMMFY
jgi:hypothetical protein